MKKNILIIDHEDMLPHKATLQDRGYQVTLFDPYFLHLTYEPYNKNLSKIVKGDYHAVIIDPYNLIEHRLSSEEVFSDSLLDVFKQINRQLPVILFTVYSFSEIPSTGLQEGIHYKSALEKPMTGIKLEEKLHIILN